MLFAIVTLVLCISLIAGGTYALFTDEAELHNHLQAGTLDITLTRTGLVTKKLDNTTGVLVTKDDYKNPEDFSTPSEKNVFEITDKDKIAPLTYFSADMKIENNSDVAFIYWIEVVNKSGDTPLDDQLLVTIKSAKGENSAYLGKGLIVGSEAEYIGVVLKGGSADFTVSVLFVDDRSLSEEDEKFINNLAMKSSVDFDIVVHAVQYTGS